MRKGLHEAFLLAWVLILRGLLIHREISFQYFKKNRGVYFAIIFSSHDIIGLMNLSVGIVGLPNVGKSTLFNALLKKQQALAANYPFATIEPNVGIVAVPDERLSKLAEITAKEILEHKSPSASSGSTWLPPLRPATVEFVDIAGLVK